MQEQAQSERVVYCESGASRRMWTFGVLGLGLLLLLPFLLPKSPRGSWRHLDADSPQAPVIAVFAFVCIAVLAAALVWYARRYRTVVVTSFSLHVGQDTVPLCDIDPEQVPVTGPVEEPARILGRPWHRRRELMALATVPLKGSGNTFGGAAILRLRSGDCVLLEIPARRAAFLRALRKEVEAAG